MLINFLLYLLTLKGGDIMSSIAVVYATLIIDGMKTFSQVPVSLQPQVHEYLLSMGLGDDGKPLPTDPVQA
jgi:hypothetical protein